MDFLGSIYVRCPICKGRDIRTDEQVNRCYSILNLWLACHDCDATFQAHYEITDLFDVAYGCPIGPVYQTDHIPDALAVWELDDSQWIRTDGVTYIVGFGPGIYAWEYASLDWNDTSPEHLSAHYR